MSAITIISLIIATVIPITALFIIYTRDLYSTGSFRYVVYCFIWGGVAFAIASLTNRFLIQNEIIDRMLVLRFVAPIEEEILKGLLLLFLVRRRQFTYFVDGAIYGFSIGIGFAVFENYEYLLYTDQGYQLMVAVVRVVSTNLMHALCSSIIGIVLGYSRFSKRSGVIWYILGGLAAAIGIHTLFNNIANSAFNTFLLIAFIIAFGVGGFSLLIRFIHKKLLEARGWIGESLGMVDRVTAGETSAVLDMKDLEKIIEPLAAIFGEEKAKLIEKLLLKQARLGILRKMLVKQQDETLLEQTRKEIDVTRDEMDEYRKAIGSYAMTALRGMYPEGDTFYEQLGNLIEQRIATGSGPRPGGLWDKLGSQVVPAPTRGPEEE